MTNKKVKRINKQLELTQNPEYKTVIAYEKQIGQPQSQSELARMVIANPNYKLPLSI